MDGWIDGWMDGRTDGWMDGLTEAIILGAGERGQLGRIPQYLIEKWS